MAQRPSSNDAAVKDALTTSLEECALDMVQSENYAAVKGAQIKLRKEHGACVKRCSSEGCTNHVVNNGVYVKHGANVKQCSSEGCTNQARKGGVCNRHGAKTKRCSNEGCTNYAKCRGVCIRHGAYRNTHDESTAFAFGSEFEDD